MKSGTPPPIGSCCGIVKTLETALLNVVDVRDAVGHRAVRLGGRHVQLAVEWQNLRREHPKMRIRDAAQQLGVPESALVALGAGSTSVRLVSSWREIIATVPSLGRVMALTRNEYAVHERRGTYGALEGQEGHGLILGKEIDLRIFFSRWNEGFAVVEQDGDAVKRSLQFFDAHGEAVHKIHLVATSDVAAFDALTTRFRSSDQSLASATVPRTAETDPEDVAVDVERFRSEWDALQDTHDFWGLLYEHGVGRLQALRLGGAPRAEAVPNDTLRNVLHAASATKVPLMVFVSNRGIVQIHTGPVERIQPTGPWINVLDPDFNLHVREDQITTSWVVRKPTRDGVVTSLELFAADGTLILQLFGERKPGTPELTAWRDLIDAQATAKQA